MNLKSHLKVKKKSRKKCFFGGFVELKEKIYTPFRIFILVWVIIKTKQVYKNME